MLFPSLLLGWVALVAISSTVHVKVAYRYAANLESLGRRNTILATSPHPSGYMLQPFCDVSIANVNDVSSISSVIEILPLVRN